MPKSYSEGLWFPPILAPLPPPGFSAAIMILSLFRANTLKSSRRKSLK